MLIGNVSDADDTLSYDESESIVEMICRGKGSQVLENISRNLSFWGGENNASTKKRMINALYF